MKAQCVVPIPTFLDDVRGRAPFRDSPAHPAAPARRATACGGRRPGFANHREPQHGPTAVVFGQGRARCGARKLRRPTAYQVLIIVQVTLIRSCPSSAQVTSSEGAGRIHFPAPSLSKHATCHGEPQVTPPRSTFVRVWAEPAPTSVAVARWARSVTPFCTKHRPDRCTTAPSRPRSRRRCAHGHRSGRLHWPCGHRARHPYTQG